ncbi:MAG: hypothetical protein V1910_02000 [bacterium]
MIIFLSEECEKNQHKECVGHYQSLKNKLIGWTCSCPCHYEKKTVDFYLSKKESKFLEIKTQLIDNWVL